MQKSLDLTSQGAFNIGNGNLISTKDIAESIIHQLGSQSVIEQLQINEMAAQIRYDVTWAERELGWQASISWQYGVRELL